MRVWQQWREAGTVFNPRNHYCSDFMRNAVHKVGGQSIPFRTYRHRWDLGVFCASDARRDFFFAFGSSRLVQRVCSTESNASKPT